MCKYGGWFLQVFFVPFPQGSGSFPYVFFITIHLFTLVTVDDITFVVLGVLILKSDQQVSINSLMFCKENNSTVSVMVSSIKRPKHIPRPYTPQNKNAQSIQPVTQPDHKKPLPPNNPTQVTTGRPERDTKAPVKLDL